MSKKRTVHARNFNHHPTWFNALNYSWKKLYTIGAEVKLEKSRLIAAARKETGLHDLGKDFWDEPLDKLLWSVNNEAQLHPIGRFITKKRLESLLATRLRAEELFKKRPSILEADLYPVWMIAGLQRTGTTKLQRLLSADPDNRPLLSWEALNPVPLYDDPDEKKKRIQIAQTSENALRIIAPDFFAIHPVEHLAPEEDVLLLDVSFMSTTAEATMHVPSYASWLENTNQSAAYEYMAKLMKALQWQRPSKRWILKSPHHLEFLAEIDQSFEDVHLLWTHRSIYDCIPSFLSMVAYSRAIFSDQISLKQIADQWLKKTGYMLDKAVSFRSQQSTSMKFNDIKYEGFMTDTMSTIEMIYSSIGGIDDPLRNQFIEVNERNAQTKYGQHRYKLDDFNLEKQDITNIAKSYLTFLDKNL